MHERAAYIMGDSADYWTVSRGNGQIRPMCFFETFPPFMRRHRMHVVACCLMRAYSAHTSDSLGRSTLGKIPGVRVRSSIMLYRRALKVRVPSKNMFRLRSRYSSASHTEDGSGLGRGDGVRWVEIDVRSKGMHTSSDCVSDVLIFCPCTDWNRLTFQAEALQIPYHMFLEMGRGLLSVPSRGIYSYSSVWHLKLKKAHKPSF